LLNFTVRIRQDHQDKMALFFGPLKPFLQNREQNDTISPTQNQNTYTCSVNIQMSAAEDSPSD